MSTDYAALADTIKIEDISTDANQHILQCLKNNDEHVDKLYINKDNIDNHDKMYIPKDGEDIGWLGYYIGNNTKLQELHFSVTIKDESFYKEMIRNRSIKKIRCFNVDDFNVDSLDQKLFFILSPFFENNNNLTGIDIRDCDLEADVLRQLALAIGGCKESLKSFEILESLRLYDNPTEDGNMVDIITSLSMHSQLKVLKLQSIDIGRKECTALSTLLRCTTTQLQTLDLRDNNIDDEGIEALVSSLSDGNQLRELNLSRNELVTIKGWERVSNLLEIPCSNLEMLDVSKNDNNIGNEGARIFANALKNNSTLNALNLKECYLSSGGWLSFLNLLCATSSINSTYLSNHTLQSFVGRFRAPDDITSNLELNKTENKGEVAMKKILKHHSHFDMKPFFEWEFKVLPIMISWFAKASACASDYEEDIKKLKLAAVYDFIKEFPMLYVEPCTKQELLEYSAMEITLRGSRMQHASILEEVQRCKNRALMRL